MTQTQVKKAVPKVENKDKEKSSKPAKVFEHPVLEREQMDVGNVTRVKGMMPLLRTGGTRKKIVNELTKFYEQHGFPTENNAVEKHIVRTLARIEAEIKKFKAGETEGKSWWNGYKIVSNTKENVKVEFNPAYKG